MGALFPPWSDHVMRAGLLAGLAGGIGAPSLLMLWVRTPYNTGQHTVLDQPVQFDHRHHVNDDGIACGYCHSDAWRGPYAGVPTAAVCMGCHNQVWNASPLLEPVRRAAYTGEALRWRRVNRLPHFVFFNHAAHVNHGVGCVTCHGRVDQMPQVYAEAPLTMQWCLECHRDPAPRLRPLDRVEDMTWQPPDTSPAYGRALQHQVDADPSDNCTTCHR